MRYTNVGLCVSDFVNIYLQLMVGLLRVNNKPNCCNSQVSCTICLKSSKYRRDGQSCFMCRWAGNIHETHARWLHNKHSRNGIKKKCVDNGVYLPNSMWKVKLFEFARYGNSLLLCFMMKNVFFFWMFPNSLNNLCTTHLCCRKYLYWLWHPPSTRQ